VEEEGRAFLQAGPCLPDLSPNPTTLRQDFPKLPHTRPPAPPSCPLAHLHTGPSCHSQQTWYGLPCPAQLPLHSWHALGLYFPLGLPLGLLTLPIFLHVLCCHATPPPLPPQPISIAVSSVRRFFITACSLTLAPPTRLGHTTSLQRMPASTATHAALFARRHAATTCHTRFCALHTTHTRFLLYFATPPRLYAPLRHSDKSAFMSVIVFWSGRRTNRHASWTDNKRQNGCRHHHPPLPTHDTPARLPAWPTRYCLRL